MVGVKALPSFLFMNRIGEIITVVSGFIKPKDFINILGYIKDECYKNNVPFVDYVKGKVDCK